MGCARRARRAPGGDVDLRTERDVAKVHDRMGCILRADQVDAWLSAPDAVARELLRPLPEGVLSIRKAEDVDWSAA